MVMTSSGPMVPVPSHMPTAAGRRSRCRWCWRGAVRYTVSTMLYSSPQMHGEVSAHQMRSLAHGATIELSQAAPTRRQVKGLRV